MSFSSSTNGWEGARYASKNCRCGITAIIEVTKNEKNKGRLYYACVTGACKWLGWCRPITVSRKVGNRMSFSSSTNGWEDVRYASKDCKCGITAIVKVSEKVRNEGRLYYACVTGACKWLGWCRLITDNVGAKEYHGDDMEDLGGSRGTQKRTSNDLKRKKKRTRKDHESLYSRFRKRTGLYVTDITSTEWCEKQMEFVLQFGRRTNHAMKAGTARHVKLEEEVFKRVKVSTVSAEDMWALKFINFITGVNQLMVDGLTRELPVIGTAEGVWIVGVVDEIRIRGKKKRVPMFVDIKTRVRDTLPSDAQRRNGRLQLMCYKSLWDKAVTYEFPSEHFYDSFSLNPYNVLSDEIRRSSARASIPAKTLDDIIMYYRNTCSMLVPADIRLLIRYESQKDNSVLIEDQFFYDPNWLKRHIQDSLEFWMGEREPKYVLEEDSWKCRHCQFNSVCPAATDLDPY